ncbi:DNA-binding transcription factor yap1 [Entophlyctis luteolus]|nr:DNA-binding transcription factor yap1 [Entophlyctis luteolus]
MASSSLPPPPLPASVRAAAMSAQPPLADPSSASSALLGSAASVSSPAPAQEKQRSKAGRKLASDEPVSKRLAQSREAQRAFRERRANHVRDLESKVSELTKIVEARGPTPMELELQQKVSILEAENSILRRHMSFGFDFVKQPTILPAVGSLYPSAMPLLSGYPFSTFANQPPLVTQNPLLFGLKPSVQSILGGATASTSTSSSGNLSNELALDPFGLNVTSDTIIDNLLNKANAAEVSSDADDILSLLMVSQRSPEAVPTVVSQSASDSKSDDASPLSGPLPSSASDPDMEVLESLLSEIRDAQNHPKAMKDLTLMERCELISKEAPFAAEAYAEIQKIPSLAGHDDLVDSLCESFLVRIYALSMLYLTRVQQELKCSQMPFDTITKANLELKVHDVQAKILDICTPEDAEKFKDVMHEKRFKKSLVFDAPTPNFLALLQGRRGAAASEEDKSSEARHNQPQEAYELDGEAPSVVLGRQVSAADAAKALGLKDAENLQVSGIDDGGKSRKVAHITVETETESETGPKVKVRGIVEAGQGKTRQKPKAKDEVTPAKKKQKQVQLRNSKLLSFNTEEEQE